MRFQQIRLLVVTLPLFASLACAQPRPPDAEQSRRAELDALIEASQSPDRCEWWPAVQELGRLAAADSALRDEIWSRAHVNTLGMKFVRVEPGTFTMGPYDPRLYLDECLHPVRITRPFYICVTEVTNAQYRMIFPTYDGNARYSPEPDCPAVGIAWIGAERFCEQLSDREAARYRLPTEAEWEYACRAGTDTRYSFGGFYRSGYAQLSEYAWWNYENGHASEVALLKPNNWGIYDMHGNAWEWASDWYSHKYPAACLASGTVSDPTGPPTGDAHVLRGGSWADKFKEALESGARCAKPKFDRRPWRLSDFLEVGFSQTIGFRIVRDVDGDEAS